MRDVNPLTALFKSILYFLSGRLHFEPQRPGAIFVDEHGQRFRAFRSVVLLPGPGQPRTPGAVFTAHFHVKNMPGRINRLFSLIPMWFIMGLPGFRSKYWLMDDKTGDFCGYYEWDTLEAAQAYSTSFAARFMSSRSTPGSVWFQVYPAEQAPAPPQP